MSGTIDVGNECDTVSKISKCFNTYIFSIIPNTNASVCIGYFYTVRTLNKEITDTGYTYDMDPYVDTLINWCNWGAKLYISITYYIYQK